MNELKVLEIMRILEDRPRETLTRLSRETNIPISIIFDILKYLEGKYILKGEWRVKNE